MGFFDFLFEEKKLLNESYRTDDLILPKQVIAHFKSVIKEDTQITVSFKSHPKETFGSFIGGIIEEGDGGLLIDMLVPESGNAIIQKDRKLSISYFISGAAFSFNTLYLGKVKTDFDYYKITIPKRINKFQKRKSFRITSSLANPIYAYIGAGKEEIFDISVGGISLFSSANLVRYEKSQDTLPVTIKFLNLTDEITVDATVRKSFDQTKRVDGVIKRKYSIQFKKLKMAEASLISKYMMNRQRELAAHS